MTKVYNRTENGATETVSQRQGLDEINAAMMHRSHEVKEMSQISRTDYVIGYKSGDTVMLKLVDAPDEVAPVAERTAVIYRRAGGDVMGRVVTVKGKDYVMTELVPADRPIHKNAPKGWTPTAYVTYWSMRSGERFGATRTARPSDKPGSVGHALFHNAMDHANGTGA